MRLSFALTVLAASSAAAFVPIPQSGRTFVTLHSVVEERPNISESASSAPISPEATRLTADEINARHENQMERLRAKDRTSMKLSKEDLKIIYEDEHIVVVDKPAGVLSVPTKEGNASLSQAVFEAVGCKMNRADMMVVHRLGFDTSGLMVFAKTKRALKGMNENFRTRQVQRQYEALVCGHMEKDAGDIDLPIMRDYEFPPYMRVSTDHHQRALLDLEPEEVGKKILEAPKESLTRYEVVAREDLDGQPITRVALTSVTGRTHQLNVHCAAFGHPIVGDKTYGYGGDAAPNGGLAVDELMELAPNANRASEIVMKNIAVQGKSTCIHAKSISFHHPVNKEKVTFYSEPPF